MHAHALPLSSCLYMPSSGVFSVCLNALSVCGVRRQRRAARSTQNGSTKMAGPACCWAVRERAPQVCCRQPTHSARCKKKKQSELEHGRADALCWRGCGGHPEPARPAASLRRVHMPAAPQHRSSSAASLSCGRIWHAGHKRASNPRCASSLHFPTHASIKDSTHHSLRPWRHSAMLPGESRPGRPLLLRGGPPRRRCLPPAGQTRGRTRARGDAAPARRSGAARGPRSAAPSETPARPRPPPARAAAGWCAWAAGSRTAPASPDKQLHSDPCAPTGARARVCLRHAPPHACSRSRQSGPVPTTLIRYHAYLLRFGGRILWWPHARLRANETYALGASMHAHHAKGHLHCKRLHCVPILN